MIDDLNRAIKAGLITGRDNEELPPVDKWEPVDMLDRYFSLELNEEGEAVLMMRLTKEEFEKMIEFWKINAPEVSCVASSLDTPVEHDINACTALVEYEQYARSIESTLAPGKCSPIGQRDMERFANKHNTHIEKMKKHWRCVDHILGPDKFDRKQK
jgi:hypothetical protein